MSPQLTYRLEERDASTGYVTTVIDRLQGKPLTIDAAKKYAKELRVGSSAVRDGSRKIVVVGVMPAREYVWQLLTDLISRDDAPLPYPRRLEVRDGYINIELDDFHRDHVDAWAAELQLSTPTVRMNATHGWYETGGVQYRDPGSPLLPEWKIQISCSVRPDADASAHGDGLASPDPVEYQEWLAAKEKPVDEPAEPQCKVTSGTAGGDGVRSYELTLSCGTVFGGLDTAELRETVDEHIADCDGSPQEPLEEAEVSTPSGKTEVESSWVDTGEGKPTTFGALLTCGKRYDGYTEQTELSSMVKQHIVDCSGDHDWQRTDTDEDDSAQVPPVPDGFAPVDELRIHLLEVHKNEAALTLSCAAAEEYHRHEHHGPGGLRSHDLPAHLHDVAVSA